MTQHEGANGGVPPSDKYRDSESSAQHVHILRLRSLLMCSNICERLMKHHPLIHWPRLRVVIDML